MRSSSLGSLAAGIPRASAYLGLTVLAGAALDHAVARSTEKPVVSDDKQRRLEGRLCRIRAVRLSLLDRSGGRWIERDLAYRMGRRPSSADHSFWRLMSPPVSSCVVDLSASTCEESE